MVRKIGSYLAFVAGRDILSITATGKFSGRFSYKLCGQLGAFSEIRVKKPLYFQIELLYSNPGNRLYQINKAGQKISDSTFVFNCIQLPLQAKVIVGGGDVKGYYMLGLAPSLLLGANLKYKQDTTLINYNFTSFENRFTLNMMNTIGVQFDVGEFVIPFIDFRYTQGLTGVTRPLPGVPKQKADFNLQLVLSVGIKF